MGRVVFLGDSIAREMQQATGSLDIHSDYTENVLAARGDLETWIARSLEIYDTVVVHASIHYLVRGNFNRLLRKFIQQGVSPILAHREFFLHALNASGDALRAAESRGLPNRTVIICTAMPLDIDMLLSAPAKHDWENFELLYLSHLWGEADAKAAKTTCLHPRVIVAPLHRFAARYSGLRADGMHYGSWQDNIGHFQGVYKRFIISLLHLHTQTLLEPAGRNEAAACLE